MSEEQEFVPIEQHTLTFYGQLIIVVCLPDGQPGVVLRSLSGGADPALHRLLICHHFRKTIIDYPYLCNRIRPRQKEHFWQRSPMVMSLCMEAWRPKEKRG